MKQKQIILTALTFSAGGEKIGKGMVITEGTERFAPQETPELLQLGRFRWDDHAGERFESGRPYDAEYERAGGWWVTFSQNGFLLRSVPGSGKETQHGLRRSV